MPKLTLLIPTYNEAEIITEALDKITQALGAQLTAQTEILIMDDGTDALPQIVEKNRARYQVKHLEVVRLSPPLGKNSALAAGFERARAPFTGFLDVDLSTPPRYILTALQTLELDQADAFIGSRRASGAQVERDQHWLKDILGHLLGVMARSLIFLGMRNYEDTQCGFKFFKTPIAKLLYRDLMANDGLGDIEVLIRANMMGFRVKEQGVEWTDLRESKRPLSRILWGEIKAISRILWWYKILGFQQRKLLHVRAKALNLEPQ